MNKEDKFQKEMNEWIIRLNNQVQELGALPKIIATQEEMIEHNYELLCVLAEEVKKLKDEMNALRILNLLNIQDKIKMQKVKK